MDENTLILVTYTSKPSTVQVIINICGDEYYAVAYRFGEFAWKQCEDTDLHDYRESDWNTDSLNSVPISSDDEIYSDMIIDFL